MAQFDKAIDVELKDYLNIVTGMPCWAVVAGDGTGSMLLLSFGSKFLREIPIKNNQSSYNANHFDAELSLFIMDAEWQLLNSKNNNSLICDCYSSNKKDDEMERGLSKLVNKTVKSTMLDFNGVDFEIHFEDELILCVIEKKEKEFDYSGYSFNQYNRGQSE